MNEFSKSIREMGPLGTREGIEAADLKSRIKQAVKLVPYIKMAKSDKLAQHLHRTEEYSAFFTSAEVDALFREVVSYHIAPDQCQACMICLKKCPVEAIVGAKNQIHVIDQEKCIRCGTCFEACPSRFGAVQKIIGGPVPPPIPKEKRKIVRANRDQPAAG
jgi:Fe-S-cluster-containing hydrogenase component 2